MVCGLLTGSLWTMDAWSGSGLTMFVQGCIVVAKPMSNQRKLAWFMWVSPVAALALFFAVNYCNVEALVPHAHSDASHQPMASSHHHDEDTAPYHHADTAACCETIQAVTASTLAIQLRPMSPWMLVACDGESVWSDALIESPGLASGRSPPARAPTPKLLFYRTTFASHAPPVPLA